jgi:hypothetical protein
VLAIRKGIRCKRTIFAVSGEDGHSATGAITRSTPKNVSPESSPESLHSEINVTSIIVIDDPLPKKPAVGRDKVVLESRTTRLYDEGKPPAGEISSASGHGSKRSGKRNGSMDVKII